MLLISRVTLGKLLSHFAPQFPQLYNGHKHPAPQGCLQVNPLTLERWSDTLVTGPDNHPELQRPLAMVQTEAQGGDVMQPEGLRSTLSIDPHCCLDCGG